MTDYFAVVADYRPMVPEQQWVTDYSLHGPFPDADSATKFAAAFPPLKEGGVHTLTQVVSSFPPHESGRTYVLVIRAVQWGTSPCLATWLFGPFPSSQPAQDFCDQNSGIIGHELDMGMVLDATPPN